MKEIQLHAIVKKVSFGVSTLITLDVSDDNELEALMIAPYKGQSLVITAQLPEVVRD